MDHRVASFVSDALDVWIRTLKIAMVLPWPRDYGRNYPASNLFVLFLKTAGRRKLRCKGVDFVREAQHTQSVCAGAGFLIRVSFLNRLRDRMDEKPGQIIPCYNQLKSQTQRQIGINKEEDRVYPACLVNVQDLWQPGYIIDDNEDGTNTVFAPQAPAHASGQVYVAIRQGCAKKPLSSDPAQV